MIDGIYLDDIAYDRHAMVRVRKVLERACAARGVDGPEIDLHSANQFTAHDGYASSANLYMEQLPYVDRLWLGEYFDYDTTDPDYWLVELSGIPFGLMGEMLEGGGNPWRGMVFGMTGRAPAVDNRPLWEFWAANGLERAQMQGFWDPQAPVRTSHPDVLATTWLTEHGMVVALASWAEHTEEVTLIFDPDCRHRRPQGRRNNSPRYPRLPISRELRAGRPHNHRAAARPPSCDRKLTWQTQQPPTSPSPPSP